MTYQEQLKDPRWQKKRLEILDRDNFACQKCGDTKSTLHVHHYYYDKYMNLWEYEDEFLVTLCEECHTEQESIQIAVIKQISKYGVKLWGYLAMVYFGKKMFKDMKKHNKELDKYFKEHSNV